MEELAEIMACSDASVARWYACMVRGLRARRAGRRRLCCWRPSPGCGVNRRQRSAASVSERAPLCAIEAMELYAAEIERGVRGSSQHGRLGDLWLKAACLMLSLSGSDFMELQADEFGIGACGSKRYGWLGDLWLNAVCWMLVVGDTAQSGVPQGRVARQADRSGWRGPRTSQTDGATVWRLRGCFLSGEMQVRGCVARFHGYSSKCLQAAVAAGMKGVVQKRVVSALQRTCANDDAAGYNGTVREARNFAMVRRVLVLENAYVHVYESACADALSRGELEGRWCLGATAGTYVSSLVWLRAERHVVRLISEHTAGRMDGCWSASDSVAPWFRYVVGAPKKKNRRGASNILSGGVFGATATASDVERAGAGLCDGDGAGL